MKKMTYGEALREAVRLRMRENSNIMMFGEDIGPDGGSFGVSQGLWEEFGELRIRDTPISEGAIGGLCVGAAAVGCRPIGELMFIDFLPQCLDMICNQAAKLRYMTGGEMSLPLVIRVPGGAGVNAAAQHSQSLEAWLTHIPGIKVVQPATPQDAYGLLLSAIDDDNPVIVVENKTLYGVTGEVDLDAGPIPLGKADIMTSGDDVTIIATGKMVYTAMEAAETLKGKGISAEVINLRSLYPLDFEAIKASVGKTHKVIVCSEETKRGSYSGEISATISEELFDLLDAPVVRVNTLDTPIPFSPTLEPYVLPCAADIVKAAEEM